MKYTVKATRTVEEEISVEVNADSEATARGFGSGSEGILNALHVQVQGRHVRNTSR